jgi:hypothetical protein
MIRSANAVILPKINQRISKISLPPQIPLEHAIHTCGLETLKRLHQPRQLFSPTHSVGEITIMADGFFVIFQSIRWNLRVALPRNSYPPKGRLAGYRKSIGLSIKY